MRNIDNGQITIVMYNKAMQRMAHGTIEIANHYNKEVASEGAVIQRLIEETEVHMRVNKVYPRRDTNRTFQEDPDTDIVRICNE